MADNFAELIAEYIRRVTLRLIQVPQQIAALANVLAYEFIPHVLYTAIVGGIIIPVRNWVVRLRDWWAGEEEAVQELEAVRNWAVRLRDWWAGEEEAVQVQVHNLALDPNDFLPTAEGEQRITDEELRLIPATRENFEVWFNWYYPPHHPNTLTPMLSEQIQNFCYTDGQIVMNRIVQHAVMGGQNVD